MCAQGSSGAAQALDLHTDGKDHLNPPHSVWHGHGRVLLLLVAVHLAAFLYWCAGSLLLSAVGHVQAVRHPAQRMHRGHPANPLQYAVCVQDLSVHSWPQVRGPQDRAGTPRREALQGQPASCFIHMAAS